ncbi:MAG: hypothetical protein RMK57_13705 [Bryobacterales bacterium]|nr:hypothetical protein [Bryobacteraceae bacterium]MDW8355575.1 hypothetical protein [Bryobacterales bacterium]
MMLPRRWICAVLLATLWMTACGRFRKAKPAAPASVPAVASAQPPPAEAPLPEARPAPARQEPEETPQEQPVLQPPIVILPPPLPPPRKRPSPAASRVEPSAPEPQPQAPPAPPPQLKQILTPEQRVALERSINHRLSRARATLAALRGKSLNAQQATVVEQIRTFIRQAEEARSRDLLRASNLAERADVLARELAAALR